MHFILSTMVFSWCMSTWDLLRGATADHDIFLRETTQVEEEEGNNSTKGAHLEHATSTDACALPKLVHVAQRETWDCGVACLLMIWSWLAATMPDHADVEQQRAYFLQILATQSIWTIDLVYALDQMKRHEKEQILAGRTIQYFAYNFYSTTLQANVEWKDFSYYAEAFDRDEERTHQRLRYLQQQQTKESFRCIHQQEVGKQQSIQWVLDRVCSDDSILAILLVDNTVLNACFAKKEKDASDALQSEPSPNTSYAGHYVVVTGTHVNPNNEAMGDEQDVRVVVYDPNAGIRHIPTRYLELAWQAPGTDQDVIFIQKLGHPLG